jgi:hypothetical protein
MREVLHPASRKLRVGIMLNDWAVPAWAWRMLSIIGAGDYADIALVVMNTSAAQPAVQRSLMQRVRDNRGHLVETIVRKALDKANAVLLERGVSRPDAFEPRRLDELLAGVPVIEVSPARAKWSDRLSDAELERIRAADLDVLIRLGFRVLRGGVLTVARYGIWSFHHGDNRINRGGPPGFWESMQGWPETGSILQILSEDLDNGTVLDRTYASTNATSVRANRNAYFWKSLSMLPRQLKALQASGDKAFFARVAEENADPEFYSRPLYRDPTNAQFAALIARRIWRKIAFRLENRFWQRQWILLYSFGTELTLSLWRYKRLVPPKDRFWADPHVIERGGKYYIFLEELIYATGKGHIAMMTLDAKGRASEPVTVLDRPYHISYPFVFEHGGETYMIPESVANSTIELYRCVDFPLRWEFQENLMSGVKAVDATLAFHEGRYWLFANMIENPGGSSWDELFVFHSDAPFGSPWTPHPMNPVVSDVKSARPAGPLFRHRGRLYRPAQDCTRHYGYGLVFARIDVLNEREYSETVVSRASPDFAPDVVATHTFVRAGALSLIDAQIRRRR